MWSVASYMHARSLQPDCLSPPFLGSFNVGLCGCALALPLLSSRLTLCSPLCGLKPRQASLILVCIHLLLGLQAACWHIFAMAAMPLLYACNCCWAPHSNKKRQMGTEWCAFAGLFVEAAADWPITWAKMRRHNTVQAAMGMYVEGAYLFSLQYLTLCHYLSLGSSICSPGSSCPQFHGCFLSCIPQLHSTPSAA